MIFFTRLVAISLALTWLLSGCSNTPSKPEESVPLPAQGQVQAQSLAPAFEADYTRAQLLLNAQAYDKAAPLLSKISAANPGFADAWVNLAQAYYGQKDYAKAEQAIARAQALDNKSAEIFGLAGLVQVGLGHYKQAEAQYLAAIKLDATCASCHYNLALLYDLYYQDLGKAIGQYQAYLDHITNTDEDTQAWIEELKRNLARKAGQ